MTKIHSMSDEMIAAELAAVEPDDEEDFDDAPLPPHVRVTRGHSRTRTLQVRLNDDELDRLAERADETGVPASTFARMLLLQGMDDRPQAVLPTLDSATPETMKRIKRALRSDTFNLLLSAALVAEEREEGQVVQFRRTPASKTAAKTAAKKAAAKKAAAKKAAAKNRIAGRGVRRVAAAKKAPAKPVAAKKSSRLAGSTAKRTSGK